MKRFTAFRWGAVIAAVSAFAALATAQTDRRQTTLQTPKGRFPLQVTADYLGMVGPKTVVRIRLAAPELGKAAYARGVRAFAGELRGNFLRGEAVIEAFKYQAAGELKEGEPFTYSFLRAVPPGSYRLTLSLTTPQGIEVGEGAVDLAVPEVGTAFRPEMAPGEAGTMPEAEAIVIADEGAEPVASPGEPKLKILPPSREAPVGRLRLEAEVDPSIRRVEFYLDEKPLLTRTRPPYTVEIDLGDIPRSQTVRAVGYDESGRVIDEDAWAVNQGDARLAVRVLPRPDPSAGKVRVRVAVQSIAGGVAKLVELFLDEKKVGSWASGPYEATIPFADYSRATYLRATAITEEGREVNDIRMLKGPTTSVESVVVDVVQLHVSVLDKERHFVKDLQKENFSVREDGRPQKISGFEVAGNLPLTVGLVVDGSGSMEKGMSFVHQASAELFRNLIREKDKGFVIEFRERPRFLQEITGDSGQLQRAAREVRAEGATALYDSIVLGLYQFRTLQGRKALVVVTDGADNRSHVEYPVLLRYARSAGAPIYFIAVEIPMTDFKSRRALAEIARESGGEVIHLGNPSEITTVTKRIEEELRSQYVLAFKTDSQKPPGEYRAVEVAVDRPGVSARTIRGYIP
jgi:VWFA-related protein